MAYLSVLNVPTFYNSVVVVNNCLSFSVRGFYNTLSFFSVETIRKIKPQRKAFLPNTQRFQFKSPTRSFLNNSISQWSNTWVQDFCNIIIKCYNPKLFVTVHFYISIENTNFELRRRVVKFGVLNFA